MLLLIEQETELMHGSNGNKNQEEEEEEEERNTRALNRADSPFYVCLPHSDRSLVSGAAATTVAGKVTVRF